MFKFSEYLDESIKSSPRERSDEGSARESLNPFKFTTRKKSGFAPSMDDLMNFASGKDVNWKTSRPYGKDWFFM